MAWTSPRTWVVSEIVTAALMNTHVRDNLNALSDRIQQVRKSADESVTSSTVLQDDNELQFTVVSGQSYVFQMGLLVTSTVATGDIKVLVTNTGSGTLTWGVLGLNLAATTGTDSAVESGRDSAIATTAVSMGAVNGTLHNLITGSFSATANGTVKLQWCQDTSSATATTVKAGSWLQAVRTSV